VVLRGVQNEHEGGTVDEHEQGVARVHGDVDMLALPVAVVDAGDRLRAQRSLDTSLLITVERVAGQR
jgi:hypothetical protein